MHLATFLAAAERDGGVPPFVEREFRQFVDCGVGPGLRPVSVRWLPRRATSAVLVQSARGLPSCGGRRMAERAAHLVDHVLPAAPVRQWVLSLPFRLRYLPAWNHELYREVLAVHASALRAFYLAPPRAGLSDAETGP